MDTYVGIWVDLREALITTISGGNQKLFKIPSNLDVGNVKGGSGSSTPYGPQDAVSESKFLEKKKHAIQNYFDEVASNINDGSNILITGPAEMKNELHRDLSGRHEFKNVTIHLTVADSMTDNQFKALVREYFSIK